ncbi:MAG: exodeoxyribonuclease V subunit alpha [Denitrovibrio sp.]|nr:MAG: exodeoxyribonuclease V subunit alpha [Denitrovibrio sp.]
MNKTLTKLHEERHLRDIDIYFAKSIADSFEAPEGELLFALIFNITKLGNTCLDITALDQFDFAEEYENDLEELASNIDILLIKGVICEAPADYAPFIKSGNKLYMKSFYTDEMSVSQFIQERLKDDDEIDIAKLKSLLDIYFPENSMQKGAALNAALNSFTVISGGPGTGKTSTVFSLLAVLSEMTANNLKIAVCAPTGKAASRLTETITEKREHYKDKAFIENIPEKAVTIHKLLGMAGDSRKSTHGTHNKLPYDILIADEASMIDVRLMSKLVNALPAKCKLILLGDKDQLASVQPGSVLGDICSHSPVNEFSKARAETITNVSDKQFTTTDSAYSDITIMLDKSYRYQNDKGIGLLANASGKGDVETAIRVLENDESGQIDYIRFGDNFESLTSKLILDHFRYYMSQDSTAGRIKSFGEFGILAPHRKQIGGTEHINALALKTLFKAGLCDNTKRFYHGMPLMITENDYSQNLLNGETGIIIDDKEQKACFLHENDKIRKITPARLPAFTPAYCMTVHKSQGSEFDHVLFVLPEADSPILTRELFYTAVTRAKTKLTIISTDDAIKNCIERRITRTSGLFGQ